MKHRAAGLHMTQGTTRIERGGGNIDHHLWTGSLKYAPLCSMWADSTKQLQRPPEQAGILQNSVAGSRNRRHASRHSLGVGRICQVALEGSEGRSGIARQGASSADVAQASDNLQHPPCMDGGLAFGEPTLGMWPSRR